MGIAIAVDNVKTEVHPYLFAEDTAWNALKGFLAPSL
jgi:hypothetical protein